MTNIDKIFCINLDSRPDRWDESLKEFKKIGIENKVERFSAINIQPGIIGCTKSHYECIKLAKECGYNQILILEDDVSFKDDALIILDNTLKQLNKHGIKFELLYLGANLYPKNNVLIDSNLALLKAAKTTHAYVIDSSIFDIIIDYYSTCNWDDGYEWNSQNPDRKNIDIYYLHYIQSRGRSYGVYPSIAEQRISYSDLIHTTNYYNLHNSYNNILENSNEKN